MSFETLVAGTSVAGQYLVEISAFKGGELRTGGGPWIGRSAVGRRPVARSVPLGNANSGEVTLRYGDRHWVGEPGDADKPNTYYEGRVTVPLIVERSLPLLPEEDRRVQRQFGAIEIANGDGALDDPSRYAVDGRDVRVLYGPAMPSAYSDFGVVASVLGTGWETAEGISRLNVRDRGYSLDLPLQSNLYDGTGGAEGGAELAGKPKPLAFGKCLNVSPPLVDATLLTYQLHDGVISAVDAVYDRGAALTFGANRADYATLASTAPSAGHYDTCLSAGFIRLGSSPAGLITADVRGDATGSYASTLDTIALRLIKGRAGISAAVVNDAGFTAAAAVGGVMGVYISPNETPTTADVLNRLMGAAAAWWSSTRDGLITAGIVAAPEDQAATFFLDEYRILMIEPEAPPVPRWRQRVAYQPNWTPQTTDIASGVTDARKQFLAGPARIVTWFDSQIRIRHRNALDPAPLASLYDSSTDAQALADYLGSLFGPDRGVWRLTLKRYGYTLDLGQIGRVTYPRLGLSGGRNVAIIGIREDADRDETTLRVWG